MRQKWNDTTEEFESMPLDVQEAYVNEVIAAVKAANGYIDNHDDRVIDLDDEGVEVMKFYRYGKDENNHYVETDVDLVPIYKHALCCINPLELAKSGKVHLSTWSIGGNVISADIETFNREHSAKWMKEQGYAVLSCCLGRLERVAL